MHRPTTDHAQKRTGPTAAPRPSGVARNMGHGAASAARAGGEGSCPRCKQTSKPTRPASSVPRTCPERGALLPSTQLAAVLVRVDMAAVRTHRHARCRFLFPVRRASPSARAGQVHLQTPSDCPSDPWSLVGDHPLPSPQAKRSKTLPSQRGRKRLLTVLGTSSGRGKRRHRLRP